MFTFGWLPDIPDQRDYRLQSFERQMLDAQLPAAVDLSQEIDWVYDQGALGSCVGNAAATIFRFTDNKQGGLNIKPSRLQIYYDARKLEGWQDWDSGAFIRDALKTLGAKGVSSEDTWPYDINKFAQQPPPEVYVEAEKHQSLTYMRVDHNLSAMKSCLAAGYPIIIGFTVYSNFFDADDDGVANMPSGSVLGGHAVAIVGYDNAANRFKCANSWGEGWGNKGFFTIPYAYLTSSNLSDDLWTIRMVEEETAPPPPPPNPDDEPVILRIRQKTPTKVVVIGLFDPDATLFIDGTARDVGVSQERFVIKRLPAGIHEFMVESATGKRSQPVQFTVT